MTTQTEAERLADEISNNLSWVVNFKAAAELRRLVSFNQQLMDEVARLKNALAEQPAQQEPVAVVSGYYGGQCVILPINPARIFNSNTALYTSPTAQRKPLTDEQISAIGSKIFPSTWNIRHVDFARSIEAAHGIKENT